MTNIDYSKTYSILEDVVSRNNQDGTFVLMKMDDSEMFYKIDGVAAEVWKGLEQKLNLDSIKNKLMSEYNVSESQLKSDIDQLVSTLLNKKLLK